MKRRVLARFAAFAATALLLPGLLLAHGSAHRGSEELPPAPRPAAFADHSIYQLGSLWWNDRGAQQPLSALRGRPVVLAMLYTSCENTCPVLVEDMKRIERALAPAELRGVTFALFSYDPARDTPAALAAYRLKRNLPDDGWRLFTGDADAVLELAAVLGVKYKPDGYGDFQHSNLITVLDAEGVVRHQQVGLNAPAAETAALLHTLLGR
ncbi:MAG: SCO family protein [Candidatus Lambdaproteobacteria bacterium]|nr:SCO family protein [Candidatus Lambdaproteobacteria bacterium]